MNPSYPIWSSGNTDAIVPQIYNWAQADRAEQANNIARKNAFDAQAIQNAQNYFQLARQQEAQDVQRQMEAERQSYARRLAAEQQARGDYQFAKSLEFNQKQLDANKELKKDIQIQKEQEAKDGALASLIDSANKGEYADATPEELAKLFGVSVEAVRQNVLPIRERYAQRAIDALNVQVAEMRAKKDPKKWATGEFGDSIEGLKIKLPVGLRGKVRLNRNTWQFEIGQPINPVAQTRSAAQEAVAQSSLEAGDNTGYFPWMAREQKRAEALANYEAELNSKRQQYSFSPTQTATTPAPIAPKATQLDVPVTVTSKQEYEALERGQLYIDSTGKPKRKK